MRHVSHLVPREAFLPHPQIQPVPTSTALTEGASSPLCLARGDSISCLQPRKLRYLWLQTGPASPPPLSPCKVTGKLKKSPVTLETGESFTRVKRPSLPLFLDFRTFDIFTDSSEEPNTEPAPFPTRFPQPVWSPRNPDPFSGGTLLPLKALVLVSLFSPSQALCCQSAALNLLPPASLLLQHLFPWADAMLLISPCKVLGLSLTTLVLSVRNVFGDAAAALLLQNPTAVRQPERNARAGTGTGCSQPPSLTMPVLLHPFAFARRL